MYPPEDDDYAACADCTTEVLIFDRIYAMSDGRALCFDCASHRDGVYHDVLERWTVSPRLEGLRC
jgi:hypothetical protein